MYDPHGLVAALSIACWPVQELAQRSADIARQDVCVPVQTGMSAPDFAEYQRRRPDVTAKTAANTVTLNGPTCRLASPPASDSTPVVAVAAAALHALLENVQDEHVVFVSGLFVVTVNGHQGGQEGACEVDTDYESMQVGLRKRLEKFESQQGCYPFKGQFV